MDRVHEDRATAAWPQPQQPTLRAVKEPAAPGRDPVAMHQLRDIGELQGFALEAPDGEIGRILEIYFDDEAWALRYFVVRTGGWLLGRDVLVAPRALGPVDEISRTIETTLTREQVRHCPPVDTEKPVSRHYETEYHRYYQWPPYWLAAPYLSPVPPVVMAPAAAQDAVTEPPEHPHLRSSEEVRGYHVAARDGRIGEVADFVVDDGDWSLRYLVARTRRWWPGKTVLVAPAWVAGIDWADRRIAVDLDREAISSAPDYDPARLITPEYEMLLYAHYGRSAPERGVREQRSGPAAG